MSSRNPSCLRGSRHLNFSFFLSDNWPNPLPGFFSFLCPLDQARSEPANPLNESSLPEQDLQRVLPRSGRSTFFNSEVCAFPPPDSATGPLTYPTLPFVSDLPFLSSSDYPFFMQVLPVKGWVNRPPPSRRTVAPQFPRALFGPVTPGTVYEPS